jgi:hypothetical protein
MEIYELQKKVKDLTKELKKMKEKLELLFNGGQH